MTDTTQWQGPERRTNPRLRALIDDLRGELRDTRHALEFLRERVSALSVELEEVRRAHNQGRPSVVGAGCTELTGGELKPGRRGATV